MPDEQVLLPCARASGEWRGARFERDARVRLHQRGLLLTWRGAGSEELRLPFGELSGFGRSGGDIVLHGPHGRITLASAQPLDDLWQELLARAFALPELARGARTVGSRRGGDAATQARFFGPLLAARRRAEVEAAAEGKLRMLDGASIAAATLQLLNDMARARWPDHPPEQRALGAELEECCEGMFAACAVLAEAAGLWLDAPNEQRLHAWRAWLSAAERLFAESDKAWGSVALVLGAAHTA